MEKLIKIQAMITNIEEITLDVKYHSSFNYINENELEIKSFCFDQMSAYKRLLDHMKGTFIIVEDNSTIRILNYE